MALTKQEAGRLGGRTTVARYGTGYMAWIGRRGGANEMARQWREMIPLAVDDEQREYYEEKARAWAVPTGTKVMLGLWQGSEPRSVRRPANGEITRLRQWNKAAGQW